MTSWRLSMHHLAQRAPKQHLARVVSDVCGVQAQVMSAAEMGIWARVEDVTSQDVKDALWKHRTLVKTWCMRGTLHLLASSDLPSYVAALKTRLEFKKKLLLKEYRWLSPSEIESIIAGIRKTLDGQRLTREELANAVARLQNLRPRMRKEMLSGWGSLLSPAAYQGYLCFGPSQGQNVTFVRPDQWLGKWDEPSSEEALKTLLQRFLRTYGPATPENFAHWWGEPPSKARGIMTSLAGVLEEVEFERRRSWINKTDAEEMQSVNPQASKGSVHLLPSFDCYVMFYHPRELFVSNKFRPKIFRQLAGWNSPVLLVDGIARGIWERKQRRDRIEVTVEPFKPLSSAQKKLVEREAARLGGFLESKVSVSYST